MVCVRLKSSSHRGEGIGPTRRARVGGPRPSHGAGGRSLSAWSSCQRRGALIPAGHLRVEATHEESKEDDVHAAGPAHPSVHWLDPS